MENILMCRPDFFKVSYEINAWMAGNIDKAVNKKAEDQWGFLAETISRLAEVQLIDPVVSLPDMVFTANGALIHGNKAVVARFSPVERQPESAHFLKWFEKKGFEVLELPENMPFEGAGDALFDTGTTHDRLWAAHGFRSSLASHAWLAKTLDIEVLSLELVNPHYYHLDTCFCPLDTGHVMFHPDAFSTESQLLIIEKIGDRLITVGEEDAKNFCLNAVNVGKTIILNKATEALKIRLQRKGFVVKETPINEFMKAGGGTKCLTLRYLT